MIFILISTIIVATALPFLNSNTYCTFFKNLFFSYKNINETQSTITTIIHNNKILPDNDTLENLDSYLSGWRTPTSYITDLFSSIIEPVHISYSSELLDNQIYHLSIILFIISIIIIALFIVFIFNLLIYVYSDKIGSFFKNKYIKWYINFNKKIIAIELFFLVSTILYGMYFLSYGIHFIATHPIFFN